MNHLTIFSVFTNFRSRLECLLRAENLARDKHSSLIQKFVNYGRKSFITLAPGVDSVKPFLRRYCSNKNKLECLSMSSFSCLTVHKGIRVY
jgi:hypothetical protein